MPIEDHILEVRVVVDELGEGPDGRDQPCLDAPEGQVEVRTGQGPIHGPIVDCLEELVALGEPLVVLEEPTLPLVSREEDANAHCRPGPIEALCHKALKDPEVHMARIWRSTITIVRRHEDQLGVDLLRVGVEDLSGEGLLDPLGKLLELAHIDLGGHLRGLEVGRHLEEKRRGAQEL